MALFGLLGKKQSARIDCVQVARGISELLWGLANKAPDAFANPYGRIMLRKDSSVYYAGDKRDPAHLFERDDVFVIFIHENSTAFSKWVEDIKQAAGNPLFQQIATEEFAKALTRTLMQTE